MNIIGNEVFSNEELFKGFELAEGSFFSFLSSNDAYSREKLKGDIESGLSSILINSMVL